MLKQDYALIYYFEGYLRPLVKFYLNKMWIHNMQIVNKNAILLGPVPLVVLDDSVAVVGVVVVAVVIGNCFINL